MTSKVSIYCHGLWGGTISWRGGYDREDCSLHGEWERERGGRERETEKKERDRDKDRSRETERTPGSPYPLPSGHTLNDLTSFL